MFRDDFLCQCGRRHKAMIDDCIVEKGAILKLPMLMEKYNAQKAYVISDKNTYSVAGHEILKIFDRSDIKYKSYIFDCDKLWPNERSVGAAIINFTADCDIVIGVGSGVINDICKIVASVSKLPYIIVATAPSMDGYASATSSVELNGLKISLPSKCANAIVGDIDILKNAPAKMLVSGLGDMIAKYVSLCEWEISSVVTNEYFCPTVSDIVRRQLDKCVENSKGLLKRDEESVSAIFEGLVICGAAMNYVGMSRPASGVEHYFSHIWDMRALEFGEPSELHGIQCAVGTLYAIKLYEYIRNIEINREKATSFSSNFDYNKYADKLRSFLGNAANQMIELEKREQKYNSKAQIIRIDRIIENRKRINEIIDKLPSSESIYDLLISLGCPTDVSDFGIDRNVLPMTFVASKDIRFKYVLSMLCHDVGIIDDMDILKII